MASLNIPNSFSNNTVADATQVNSNFTAVKNFAESAVVQVDGSVKAPTIAIEDGAVTAAKLASALPKGVVAREIKTTNGTSGTSGNCFTGLTFTPTAGRLYRVSASVFFGTTMNDYMTTWNIFFCDGSNNVIQYLQQAPFAGAMYTSISDSYLWTPVSATATTINIRFARSAGTDTGQFIGNSTSQNYIMIEDLGVA